MAARVTLRSGRVACGPQAPTRFVACVALSWLLVACGEPDLTCAPPAGSIATAGNFQIDFVGETASVSSDTMQVRVSPRDVDAIDVWACQERDDVMWIVELSVMRGTLALPAPFGFGRTSPRVTARLSRYDQYQLLEDMLGDTTNAQVNGQLADFDDAQGALTFAATLSAPCDPVRCQADDRTLMLDADLSWEAP